MKPNLPSRQLLLACLFVATSSQARAEAEVVREADIFEGLASSAKPVVEVRGETPYVEVDGKLVAVAPEKVKFYASNGPITVNARIPPAWVSASQVNAVTRPLTTFNREFRFSVQLESPTPLDKAFVVVVLRSDQGESRVYFREVGLLRPYRGKTVRIEKSMLGALAEATKTMLGELGQATVTWHLFVGGREVLHSLMDADVVARNLNVMVTRARKGVREAPAEPYLTYPPRGLPKNPGAVTLDLDVSREGTIEHASVAGGNALAFGKNLLESVSSWRFLPQVVEGKSVAAKVTVAVDLARWQTWSNDCVRLVSPVTAGPGNKL